MLGSRVKFNQFRSGRRLVMNQPVLMLQNIQLKNNFVEAKGMVQPNHLITNLISHGENYGQESRIRDHRDFIKMKYKDKYPPSHIRQEIPLVPTDIRGVDLAAYNHIGRKQVAKNIPTVISNRFFHLKFLPRLHFISLTRKSFVAYMFTNRGGFNLNDAKSAKALASYNGKYRKLGFFQERLCPLDTAVGRAKYRKYVKRTLHKCLLNKIELASQMQHVAGIFFFRLSCVPVTDQERRQFEKSIEQGVEIVDNFNNDNSEFHKKLTEITKTQNKQNKYGELLLKDVRRFNTLNAKSVPGYYPKLPYINNKHELS